MQLCAVGRDEDEVRYTGWGSHARDVRRSTKPASRLADGHDTDASRGQHGEASSEARHSMSAKRHRTDLQTDPHADPHTDPHAAEEHPHVPRRKRSKPTELIRPLEALAAANSAALGMLIHADPLLEALALLFWVP